MIIKHILPINDLKEHRSDGLTCFCRPEVVSEPERSPEGHVYRVYFVTHNALDGREWAELANKNNLRFYGGATNQ